MQINIINPEVKPWNVFGSHFHPDLAAQSNVIIDGKEWFNSFMPPFITEKEIDLAKGILNDGSQASFMKYEKYLTERFTLSNWPEIIKEIYTRLGNYVEFEKDFIHKLNRSAGLDELLKLWHFSFNASQFFLDSIEPLGNAKKSKYNPFFCYFTIEEYWNLIKGLPSVEIIFVPLAVLSGEKEKFMELIEYLSLKLLTSSDLLTESLKVANQRFGYGKLMSSMQAKKILLGEQSKLRKTNLSGLRKVAYDISNINALITWSKYIILDKNSCFFRFDSMSYLNKLILGNPKLPAQYCYLKQMKTTSGSEVYGKGIYVVTKLM